MTNTNNIKSGTELMTIAKNTAERVRDAYRISGIYVKVVACGMSVKFHASNGTLGRKGDSCIIPLDYNGNVMTGHAFAGDSCPESFIKTCQAACAAARIGL